MEVKCGVPTCVFKQLIQNVQMAHTFVILYCTLTVFVPIVITLATFVHLRSVIKKHRYVMGYVKAKSFTSQLTYGYVSYMPTLVQII